MVGLSGGHDDKYRLDATRGRVCSFAVLFPDTSWAGGGWPERLSGVLNQFTMLHIDTLHTTLKL